MLTYIVHVKTAILTYHCAKTATAEQLHLEEDELEGENIASLVSLDHIRELRVAHFQAVIGRESVQDSVAISAVLCEAGNSSINNTVVSGLFLRL